MKLFNSFLIIVVFILFHQFSYTAQTENFKQHSLANPSKPDSIQNFPKYQPSIRYTKIFFTGVIPKPSIRNQFLLNKPSFFTFITLNPDRTELSSPSIPPRIDWNISIPGRRELSLDYRESSIYLPSNVREFMEYKMGRSRYVPVVTMSGAAYLAYMIYKKYGDLLKKREENHYVGLNLSDREIQLLKTLWKHPGLTAPVWYAQTTGLERQVTFLTIKHDVKNLEEKYLLKTRKMSDGQIKYFPALDREVLIQKLKNELTFLDAIRDTKRISEIRQMLNLLKE